MIFFKKERKRKKIIKFTGEKEQFPPNATNGALTLPMIINLIKGEDFTTTGTQTYALKNIIPYLPASPQPFPAKKQLEENQSDIKSGR